MLPPEQKHIIGLCFYQSSRPNRIIRNKDKDKDDLRCLGIQWYKLLDMRESVCPAQH